MRTSARIFSADPDNIIARIPPDVLERVDTEDVAAIAAATSYAAVTRAVDALAKDHLRKVATAWVDYIEGEPE